MEKLNMQSMNVTAANVEKIAALFPSCVTERLNSKGVQELAIDFDKLRMELGADVLDETEERYQFTWPDKREAIRLSNARTTMTLRPCREESVDYDNTENLYIEGDNLEVLKVLQQNYLGKVKMIYIDPPYNTGKDFVYKDKRVISKEEYVKIDGLHDEEGNQLVLNTESNGRFHTDWLNFMYPRLKVARNLLSNDGIVFISIDDNEVENMRKICDEIFGEKNFASPFIWQLPRGINAGLIARSHEYILCYTKKENKSYRFNRLTDEIEYSIERCNKKIDKRHPESDITFPAGIRYEGKDQIIEGVIEGSEKITIQGKMIFENGQLKEPVTLLAGWTMRSMINSWLRGEKVFDLKGQPIEEFFFKENGKLYSRKIMQTLSIKSILKNIPDTQDARLEMEELFGNQDLFSYPKTLELSKLFTKLCANEDDIILDFFSGSASTAHGIMKQIQEDGINRKFVLVQIQEKTPLDSVAYKEGYKNICEIGKERIRRAGAIIKKECPNVDTGFRVLKLDTSNMKDVYYTPGEVQEQDIWDAQTNIKEDRTPEDLLFQVMPECGVKYSEKIEVLEIAGKKVFSVMDNYLAACFDEKVNEEVITAIAKTCPTYFVMRDSSLESDNVADNFMQIFKQYSPETTCKII